MIRCYRCGKETEPRFSGAVRGLCPECTAAERPSGASPAISATLPEPPMLPEAQLAVPSGRPLATFILVGLNCAVFLAMVASGASFISPAPQTVLAWGADFGMMTLGGQWWRLITSMFLHFGILHIGFNMWCLWSLGLLAEKLMSRSALVLLYLVSGVGGSLLSLLWHPMLISAGASGAIFGLAGGLAALFYLKKVPLPPVALKKTKASIVSFILYNLAFGAVSGGIDNAAHMGGLLAGLAMGAALQPGRETPSLRVLRLPAIVASLTLLIAAAVGVRHVQASIADLSVAQQLAESGQTDQAIQVLRGITAEKPNLAAAHYMLGNVCLQSGRYDEAESEFVHASELDPKNVAYKINLGVVYLRKNQPQRAMPLFAEVLSKNPQNYEAQLNQAVGYSELKQYDQQLAAVNKALALRTDDARAYYVKGQALLGEKDAGQAISSFQKSVALDPAFLAPEEGLCRAYWQNNSRDQATTCYQELIKKHPDYALAESNFAALTGSRGSTP